MLQETCYPRQIEFEASISLETQRIPDRYTFPIRFGKLYSPITKRPVEESITRLNSYEEIEYKAFQKIQEYAVNMNAGVIVWISPPARTDLTAKAIVSEILPTDGFNKTLLNRNICFDWDPDLFLNFAKSGGYEIDDAESFRSSPLFFGNREEIYSFLGTIVPDQIAKIETGEDLIIKERLKADMNAGKPAPVGQYRASCGPPALGGAFQTMYENSLMVGEYFSCPRCNGKIPSGHGITTCPHCGARKEDYGGGCD